MALCAFPLPVRSGPTSIRFLTPMYLPVTVAVVWAAVHLGSVRRAWVVTLALAVMHLSGGARLLEAWRLSDRAKPPFLLPDLKPILGALESQGIRRAYASYGPAYRLTYESRERVIASQPWNERFLHFPLPYLDEVRFARDVAWVLVPAIPSDLPDVKAFEDEMATAGGLFRKETAGAATVFTRFEPPFAPAVEPLASAGAADVLPQSSLTGGELARRILALARDAGQRTQMARSARALARPDAARVIVDRALALADAR